VENKEHEPKKIAISFTPFLYGSRGLLLILVVDTDFCQYLNYWQPYPEKITICCVLMESYHTGLLLAHT